MRKVLIVAGCVLATVAATLTAQSNTRPFREGRSVCVPYDPASLKLVPSTNDTWELLRGDGAIFRAFDNREDAEAGLAVAKEHTQLCYIGKDTQRTPRDRYVMEYWR